jgi:hypothetical protein
MDAYELDQERAQEEERFFGNVLFLNAKVLGLVFGLILGLIVFVATNWLVLKGGESVGRHLRLLGQYFIGYRVSFVGSLIGFAWAFAVGTLCGAIVGTVYNWIALLRRQKPDRS